MSIGRVGVAPTSRVGKTITLIRRPLRARSEQGCVRVLLLNYLPVFGVAARGLHPHLRQLRGESSKAITLNLRPFRAMVGTLLLS